MENKIDCDQYHLWKLLFSSADSDQKSGVLYKDSTFALIIFTLKCR